ncbi:hypothetical protein FQZ97_1107940 [compost metagenome]
MITAVTRTPNDLSMPRLSATSGVMFWKVAPINGRSKLELPLNAASTTARTMFDGMAKPMPTEPPEREKIAVLIPIRRPRISRRPPPELPGLIAASV